MGGNALKTVKTERKNKEEYEIIKTEIMEKIKEKLYCEIVLEVPNKTNFGDLDVLFVNDENLDIKKIIQDTFNPKEIVHNGEVYSFDYNNFQIDFITCNSLEKLNMARFYFSYGDLGSIIGRISNYYGLKFGHKGLWLVLLENTVEVNKDINMQHTFGKVKLSKIPKEICEFLDFDYKVWENGFRDKKEIYDWIVKSKYFKKEIFNTLNYEHRSRAVLRPFYQEFLNFIEMDLLNIKKANIKEGEIKINIQDAAIKHFNKEEKVKEILNEIKLRNERKEKFNGKYLIDFGIEPKKVGQYINNFKKYIENNYKINFDIWLDSQTKESVFNLFKIHNGKM